MSTLRPALLRVKIKSLATEAAIIRLEERRLAGRAIESPVDLEAGGKPPGRRVRVGGGLRWMRAHQAPPREIEAAEVTLNALHKHRTGVVRQEARLGLLAYAFLRGRPYAGTEAGGEAPAWLVGKVADMVTRFGNLPSATANREVRAWMTTTPTPETPPSAAG